MTSQPKPWRQFSLKNLIIVCAIAGAVGGICGPSVYERLTVEQPQPPRRPAPVAATAGRGVLQSAPVNLKSIYFELKQPQRELTPGELRRMPIHGLPIHRPPTVEDRWIEIESIDN